MNIKFSFLLTLCGASLSASKDPFLLVGNTRGGNIISAQDDDVNEFLGDLENPDAFVLSDGYIYVAVGARAPDSTVFRKNLITGEIDEDFLNGPTVDRIYGLDIYEGRIYAASFYTDQVVVYEQDTGNYIGVFAQGDGTLEGLCNGPNQIEIFDDKLYLTTQGSTAGVYNLFSQVVVYDLTDGSGEVFVTPADPGVGYISMLGIEIVCDDACVVYTSDFAGVLRAYDLETRDLLYEEVIQFQAGANTGALAVLDGEVFVTGLVDDVTPGVVQRFNASDGSPLPADGKSDAIYLESDELIRPVGILALKKKPKGKKAKSGKDPKRTRMMRTTKGDRA